MALISRPDALPLDIHSLSRISWLGVLPLPDISILLHHFLLPLLLLLLLLPVRAVSFLPIDINTCQGRTSHFRLAGRVRSIRFRPSAAVSKRHRRNRTLRYGAFSNRHPIVFDNTIDCRFPFFLPLFPSGEEQVLLRGCHFRREYFIKVNVELLFNILGNSGRLAAAVACRCSRSPNNDSPDSCF